MSGRSVRDRSSMSGFVEHPPMPPLSDKSASDPSPTRHQTARHLSEGSADRVRSLFDDDRGVSEVIGSLSLVLVTVVLVAAAMPALMGFSATVPETPVAAFAFDYESDRCGDAQLTIRHDAGTSIPAPELSLSSPAIDLEGTWSKPSGYAVSGVEKGDVSVGTTATICSDDLEHTTVYVEWQRGDHSATLAKWQGPAA